MTQFIAHICGPINVKAQKNASYFITFIDDFTRFDHLYLITHKSDKSDALDYINFFWSQLTKVSNCKEKVSIFAFISELQVTYPLYKYLLKHNVAKMSEVLSWAQPYIQLEEVIEVSSKPSTRPS